MPIGTDLDRFRFNIKYFIADDTLEQTFELFKQIEESRQLR